MLEHQLFPAIQAPSEIFSQIKQKKNFFCPWFSLKSQPCGSFFEIVLSFFTAAKPTTRQTESTCPNTITILGDEMPPFCFIASSHVPRPKADKKKNVLNLREITSAIFFCQANLLVGVCLLLLHDYLRQMTRKLQSCSCSSVIVGFVACLHACVSFRTEANDWEEEELVFIPISGQSQVMPFQKCLRIFCFNQLFFFSPPAQSCRKSSFGQDWLPVQEVHQPQICPAEIKPRWGAIFNAKVAVVEIYSILYKLYIYIYINRHGGSQ